MPAATGPGSPSEHAAAPSLPLYLTDLTRATAGLGLYYAARGWERHMAHGTGGPVLVLPGLMTSDRSTRALRATLRRLGHRAHAWRLGRNIGPTPAVRDGLVARVQQLSDREGPISIVGWSLGGIYARQLARQLPDRVTRVITLGSPFGLRHASESRVHRVYRHYQHQHAELFTLPLAEEHTPLPVPATSIYSRLDGIVSWQACLDHESATSENIAVHGSHLGLGHHPAVLWAVADRLAQPADHWAPFTPPPALRWAFPAVDQRRAELGDPGDEAA